MADIKEKLQRLKKEREARAKMQPIKGVLEEFDEKDELLSEEKLKQLRKQRQACSKTDIIKEAWDEIDKDESLSVKEKLQQLISLTGSEGPSESRVLTFEPLEREPIQFFENPFPLGVRYGKITLSSGLDIKGDVLTWLSKDTEFESLDLSTALFIDLETTGLSGGTGVVPFLVGMGYYRDDKFYVSQYFLGEMGEEERMIQELGQFLTEMNFQSVVSYNGKGFDIPLLETRFILHRKPFLLSELPHLDFLYSARSLWRHKHENCRLFHLAREVVNADRAEDIPSAEIPWRYFQYLNTGNFELIEPILYHNQEDILSLRGVGVAGALVFSEKEEKGLVDAMDLYGAGKIMEKVGEVEKSLDFFQKALDGELSDEISLEAKKKISYHFKKNQDWEKAVMMWKEMTSAETASMSQLLSFRELAMYLEHKEKKFEEAREIAEEGFVMSMGFSSYYEKDFAHRLDRLKQKIRRKKEKDAEPKKIQSKKKESTKKQSKLKDKEK
jgi:uncharacterized protein YprB with RNaseH-like and TPR domain